MCNSPTANYYKPTDEPEPWDLTQLNIEASMMCLVSKVKFLCGRVGSPAVRLRSQSSRKFQPLGAPDTQGAPLCGAACAPVNCSVGPLANKEET